ncbi:MAG: gliding motility-associated C-terminal domain-containing protein [Hymenobacteraceae bacterium]|nr:gliding motility-associated C-terminal domain-containing protein [Hymenobacteraceae bacterium]
MLRLLILVALLLPVSIALAEVPPGFGFVPNRGQWPAAVQLRAEVAPGLTVFLEARQLRFLRYDAPAWAARAHAGGAGPRPDSVGPVSAHAWVVELVGARRGLQPVGEGKPFGPVRNYFLGRDARRWASNLRATPAARYAEAWPGISLTAHSSPVGAFEYDLDVQAGADPARIRLRYRGLERLQLDARSGHLQLRTALGELQEAAPVAWQLDAAGHRVPVPCRFVLMPGTGPDDAGLVSFALPASYDRRRPLIIDPVLVAATYSGSISPTFGHTATYDATGHLYAAGPCYDPGYPTTLGAFDLTHSDEQPTIPTDYLNPDVAVSRYSPDGRQLLYATYIGGHEPDYPHSLLVNHRGELLLLGSTASADFPTTPGAYDQRLGRTGTADIFVAKLDSTGSRLLGSTFVGGTGNDGRTPDALRFFYGDTYRGDLAVDSLDRVFVATSTESADFPFTSGSVIPPRAFLTSSAVVLRLNANLTTLEWAAGLGDAAAAYGLYVPPSGAPYVVGTTYSAGLPVTPGTLDSAPAGQSGRRQRDGFVAQLTADGSAVRAATYLRPGADEGPASQSFFIQPDPFTTDVYVLGSSTGFYPATTGTWGQYHGGLVIQRLSANLAQRRWTATVGHPVTFGFESSLTSPATYPDTDNLSPTAFLVDKCGSLYVSGWGRTRGLLTTPDAIQPNTAGDSGGDLYLAVLNPDATALHYATFLGGSSVSGSYEEHVDGGTSRFDPAGRVYQAVCTNAHDFPTTVGAWQTRNSVQGNAYDEVAFKLDFEPRLVRAAAASATATGQSATTFEAPADVHFTNQSSQFPGTIWQWSFGDGSATSTAYEPNHLYAVPGTYTVQLITTDPSACGAADTAYLQILIQPNDSTDYLPYQICRGDSAKFKILGSTLVPGSFTWSPAVALSDPTALEPTASPRTSTVYSAKGLLPGSSRHNTIQVAVTVLQPDTVLLTVERHCLPGGVATVLQLSHALRVAVWEFGDGSPPQLAAQAQRTTHFYSYPGTYTARVRGLDAKGCSTGTNVQISADELFVPNVFTPNLDGVNDTFVVGCLEPGTASLSVYNRWGRLVYKSGKDQYHNEWDGSGLSAGLYYYYLQLTYAPAGVKGWVQIIR